MDTISLLLAGSRCESLDVAGPGVAPLAPAYREVPYWWDEAELPVVEPGGGLPTEVDVVVVGGGYTGLAAGHALVRAGQQVVVLEARELGWGASTRNGGMVHPGVKWGAAELLERYGDLGRAMFGVTSDAFDALEKRIADLGIDCAWVRSGHVELAHRPRAAARLRRDAEVLTEVCGQPAEFVGRDELRAEIGTDAYHAGLRVEKSGGLHPARYFAGLARAALAAGVDVRDRTPAAAIATTRRGFEVMTPRGVIRCRDVLVATNGYTRGPFVWLRRRILPVGSYIIATEPIDGALAAEISPKGRMFFDTKNFLFYWRLSPDGTRVLFGGRTSFAPTTVARSRDLLYAAMVRVHPQLAGVRVEFAWGGKVALTVDRLPHIGRAPETGVAYAMGYCGTGVALSTHFGELAGQWMAGTGELPPFARLLWRTVPPPARVPWLLPVAGWWYKAQDRRH